MYKLCQSALLTCKAVRVMKLATTNLFTRKHICASRSPTEGAIMGNAAEENDNTQGQSLPMAFTSQFPAGCKF